MNNNDDLAKLSRQQLRDTEPSILDSKHIVTTLQDNIYDIKLVDCGDYIQVYKYEISKVRRNSKEYEDLELNKVKFDLEDNSKSKELKIYDGSKIEQRSITRSKLECQRIAKANMSEWESFITLTFKDNIKDLQFANKRFRYFIDKVQRVFKDFKYLCITEFQKRGAVHYHLLTNIKIDSDIIPKREKLKLWNQELNCYKEIEYYDIKYWLDGFSSAEPLNGDSQKVVGYISKYMTKDIDNRLFNRHRYFYSRNARLPKENYINLNNPKAVHFYTKKIQDKNLIYQNEYINPYDNTKVTFLEFLK